MLWFDERTEKLLVWENVTWDFWGYIFVGNMWVLGGEWGVYYGFRCYLGLEIGLFFVVKWAFCEGFVR